MAMILPKGIVVNSSQIEGQIERIDREPLKREEIARFWKVYTTTGRRLRDPTAERLENYWWRIWGSRRRELKGATVARLFAQISDGESFVPLRSPVNRDEGTPPSRPSRRGPVTSSASTTALNSRRGATSSRSASKAPTTMPPPILKKSRGPSTGGPRPTARFISPHESEVDSSRSSPVSPNAHVVVQPPSQPQSPSKQQKIEIKRLAPSSAVKKRGQGFVASTAASKKRPIIVKRQSSLTSQSSSNESTTKSIEAAQDTMQEVSAQDPGRKLSGQSSTLQQENFSHELSSNPSPRKRPSATRPTPMKRTSPRKTLAGPKKSNGTTATIERKVSVESEPGPSTVLHPVQNGQARTKLPIMEDPEEIEVQRLLLEQARVNVQPPVRKATRPTPRTEVQVVSRSAGEPSKQDMSNVHVLPSGVKSTVSLATAFTPATAELAKATTALLTPSPGRLDKGKGRDPEELRRAEMFSKRPVQPISECVSTAPSHAGPLSKSKSQLTLLLEKDRARSGEYRKPRKSRESSRESKRRDER